MLSRPEKLALLAKLRRGFQQNDPRGWVARLQERFDDGERLSTFQLECLKGASRAPRPKDAVQVDLAVAKRRAMDTVEAYHQGHPEGY